MNLFSIWSQSSLPKFCRKNQLVHCWTVILISGASEIEWVLILVKRILKLFPFESTEIEVDQGRSCDRFGDWDSYLEWFRAETPTKERLFNRIRIYRREKVLGYIELGTGISVFTQHDQSGPFGEALKSIQPEFPQLEVSTEKTLLPLRMGFKLFQLFR
jgi:hypothetical protein